jgi:NTE family protein
MKQPRPKIGLAFAGGAARGIAHLGVLKVLEEYQYPIDYLAGTSMGAIVAGAYAAGLNLSLMEEILRQIRWKDLGKVSLSKRSLMSNQPLEDLLHAFL